VEENKNDPPRKKIAQLVFCITVIVTPAMELKTQNQERLVEKTSECHFERAEGESRNLLLIDFSALSRLVGTSVEMTAGSFYKAN
jgi:hypothetical protein